jgi:hypothetical protein
VPAVCVGSIVTAPPALLLTMKPAVEKVMLQLLAAAQPTPSGQHWRLLAAAVVSPESVTVDELPLPAAGQLSVVLATPPALKVTLVDPSVPPAAASVAVCPLTAADGLVHGLLASAQAVTVTLLARQARLLLGSANS